MEDKLSLQILQIPKEKLLNTLYEQLYGSKLNNLDEMDKFPEKHKLTKVTQEKIEKMNSPTFQYTIAS